MESILDLVEKVVAEEAEVRVGMQRLIEFGKDRHPHDAWEACARIDFATADLRRWLSNVLKRESVPDSVCGIWFGLFHPVIGADSACTTDVYIGGAEEFDPDDECFEWAAGPLPWAPEPRAESEVLSAIHRLAYPSGKLSDQSGIGNELLEPLALAYVGLCIREIFGRSLCEASVPDSIGVAFGWDSGDGYLLGYLSRSAFAEFAVA